MLMAQINWDWQLFLIGLFTLIVIQFLEEYQEHKSFNFTHFKKYTLVFWFFNIFYVIFGAVFAAVFGNSNNPLSAIIYAGSWEGILGTLLLKKNEEVKK